MVLARLVFAATVLAQLALGQRVITRIAGADWLFPANGLPALNAPLSAAYGLGIAVDNKGSYYIADGGNLMVMRVGPDGIVDVIAGNGLQFASGDGGLAVNAAVFLPTSVAVDAAGNVYIAEYGSRIRKVTPDGVISTVAGTGDNGYSSDHGAATDALLNAPFGIALDSAGNLYIADTYNNVIRKVSNGVITTIAGTGQPGSSGDGGSALNATLYLPTRLAVDAAGNVYFVETTNTAIPSRVRKVDTSGNISTVAGGGSQFSDGILATNAGMIALAVTVDASGNLYIVDSFAMGIRKVNPQGIISTIAGGSGTFGFSGDGGPALKAQFSFQAFPSIAADASGNVYVDDEANERVRLITPDGLIHTIAGNGLFRMSGNGGPAASATVDYPMSAIQDGAGNIYISEPLQNRIRRIAPDGTISLFAGNGTESFTSDGKLASGSALAFPGYMAITPTEQYLVFAEEFSCRIRYIDHSGILHTYAGSGSCADAGDGGLATKAGLRAPLAVEVDPFADTYISEPPANRIRVVFPDGTIQTLAGGGDAGYSGDNGPSTKAQLNNPIGVRYHDGFLYIADSGNNVVRRIALTAQGLPITTFAGNGTAGYSGDGGPATKAQLNDPQSINFDAAGNMYIADLLNRVIRMVTPDGTISTFAGSPTASAENDGGLATQALMGGTSDVFADPAGNVFFTDVFFDRLRAVLVNPPTFQAAPSTLAFTAPAGSAAVNETVELISSIPGVPFSVTTSASGWLSATPTSGNMPSSIQVTVDPSKLSAGSHTGTITITTPDTQPTSHSVAVTLTTTTPGAPSLNVLPASLTFSFVQGAAARSQNLSVSNAGGGTLNFSATAATVSGGSWLTATPASGALNAFASASSAIQANPGKLAPGTYSGTVTFSSAGLHESVTIPVTMTIAAVKQKIQIPQTGLTFFVVQGGGQPPPQYFNILNTGVGVMPFTVKASTLSGGSWLSVFPSSGSSDAASQTVPQIRVDVNPQGLSAGVFYGSVQVISPSANNTPQSVSVILNVLTPGSTIGPVVSPSGLVFVGVAGGESPGSQTVLIENTDGPPISYHSGGLTTDGGDWFTWLPKDATVSASQPLRLIIQPQTAGLGAGIHRGTLTLAFSDGKARAISILLVLAPAGSVLDTSGMNAHAVSGCTPKTLAPVFTELPAGFSIPVGFPGQVSVTVVDNCANPLINGDVIVNFSDNDPSLQLVSLKNGTWAATWVPENPSAQVTVTAIAQSTTGLKGSISVKGSLLASSSPPLIGPGAVVNGASFAKSAPVAPGGLIAVFGSQLAQKDSASKVPLPTELGGSSVVVAGRQAPLFYSSDGQMNAVIPYETDVNSGQQLVVVRGNAISVPLSVTIAAAAPGIFNAGNGQGTIFVNNILADASHPAKPGDVVVIYCAGLGAVSPPVPTGSPTPGAPHSTTVNQVKVSIGGVSAPVQFAGLTPGLVGVYQVNAVVPAVKAGNAVPVVMTAAGQQSQAVNMAVQ
ncbi:MAG TPA: hypothetical protein VKT81_11940 [Bryobacteraceae bacterium]|nr:hypothetical protein [Bryobacteraceae bacterium]